MSSFNKRKAVKDKAQRQKKQQIVELDQLLLDQNESEHRADAVHNSLICLEPDCFYVDEQVRRTIDPLEIEQRAASMKTNGQIQAIVVYPKTSTGPHKGKYKIDKGECRWRAAQLIEGFKLTAIIDPEAAKRNKRQRIIGQVVENDQRSDLRPLELATALQALIDEGLNQEEVALELGWITKTQKPNINKVSRILSILKLPQEGQQLAEQQLVTDLITLELLRKIFELNAKKFAVLCDLAKQEQGLSRKIVEQEFKQCKVNQNQSEAASTQGKSTLEKRVGQTREAKSLKPNPFSHERMSEPNKTSQDDDSISESKGLSEGRDTALKHDLMIENNAMVNAKIQVEWRGIKRGTLVLDKKPENSGFAWVRLEKTGDLISTELEDLKIRAVEIDG